MSIEMVMRLTCNFCDTQLLIAAREAAEAGELLQQCEKHGWTTRSDGKLLTHLCPLCVEVLDDAPPPSEDIPW